MSDSIFNVAQKYMRENRNLGMRIILVLGCSNDQKNLHYLSKFDMQDQSFVLLVIVQRVRIFGNRL
jgi:hypothetical protein